MFYKQGSSDMNTNRALLCKPKPLKCLVPLGQSNSWHSLLRKRLSQLKNPNLRLIGNYQLQLLSTLSYCRLTNVQRNDT